MDKAQIAARIDRLIGRLAKDGETDKKVNAVVAEHLGVSLETVRTWRKAVNFPRLENLDPLCELLNKHRVEARPEYILFGFQPKDVHIRERIADEGDELTLLKTFRRTNPTGQQHILSTAIGLQAAHPLDSKVIRLEGGKKRKRR